MREPNPLSTWQIVLIGLGVGVVSGVLIGGILLFARPAAAAPAQLGGISEAQAVDQALRELGGDAHLVEIAARAYALAYPQGPMPPTGIFEARWESIVRAIQARLGEEPTDVDDDQTSERMSAWLAKLTAEQKSSVREIIGAHLWDPLERAALDGDDQATRQALEEIKPARETQIQTRKFSALATFTRLRSTLGTERLDEFMAIMDDTVGLPAQNPAQNPDLGHAWGMWRLGA